MNRRAELAVVKLGGSLAFAPQLRCWLGAIANAGDVVVVPGGGPFADAVRDAQPRLGFDDAAAHRMALLAMEQYAHALAGLDPRFAPTASPAAIDRTLAAGQVPLWLPSAMVMEAADIPCSWDVTSDSLAAWLAGRLGAARLVLVKSVGVSGPTSAEELADRGIVDPLFPKFLQESGAEAVVLGPDDHAELVAHLGAQPARLRTL